MPFFTDLVQSMGGFQGILDIAKGGLQVAGAIRNMNAKPEDPMANPAIQSILQQRAQLDAYSRAIADENDPLRKRILENNMAALQSQVSDNIRNLERSVQRRIATGRPALGGGIIPGNDPRRRDETVAGLINRLAGVEIPNAARTQTLEQLKAAAGVTAQGSAANAVQPIESILGRNRVREDYNRGFGGLIDVLEQIGSLSGGTISGGQGQDTFSGGRGEDTLLGNSGNDQLVSLFGTRGGTNYAGVSNKYNLFGVV